jgi:hypothetical protein
MAVLNGPPWFRNTALKALSVIEGSRCFRRARSPAMCGVAMDVPEMAA